MKRILVVGAGLAGLTAAWRLRQAGHEVRVVEAGEAPGGRMAERRVGDLSFNTGARLLYPFGRALHRLIGEFGIGLVPIRGLSAEVGGEAATHRVELMPGLGTLAMPGLTAGERARLVGLGMRLGVRRPWVDPDDLGSVAAFDGGTLADFLDDAVGRRVRGMLFDPVFRGTRGWDCGEISPAFLAATLPHMLGRSTVFGMVGGMGALTGALAERLEVECGREVVSVGEGWARFADGEAWSGDAVVLAVPGSRVAGLWADMPAEAAGFFAGLRYNPVGIVHYLIEGRAGPVMRFIAAEMSISTFQLSPRADGRTQVYAQLSPEASRAAVGAEGLDAVARVDLRRLLPGFDERVVQVVPQSIPEKLPVPGAGYVGRLMAFRAWMEVGGRGVYCCGDYMRQALLGGACASGAAVVDLI